jgi:predicted  nucleic acid-binding Zn-ribbon protein
LVQLHHHLEHLPAREARDAATRNLDELLTSLEAQTVIGDDLAKQQKRVDDEVESLKVKQQGFDTTLYSGTVSNPRELQDLQDEIASLGRRITQLEDTEIEIMEQVEPVTASVTELTERAEAAELAVAHAEQALIAAEAELQVQLEEATRERAAAVEPVPAGLLSEYESLRGKVGIGIARLVGSQCGACHLGLSAMEAARLAKLGPGEIAHCEECGRILVP